MYPIADMFNRIRNAKALGKEMVSVPFSKMKQEIALILEREGFVERVEKKGRGIRKRIEIYLKYKDGKVPAISGLEIVSKPGQRIYMGWRDLKPVKSGYGIAIISTSKGLMTNKQAKKNKLGGEVICEVW